LDKATQLVNYINWNPNRYFHHDHIEGGFEARYPLIKHKIIKLDGLAELLNSSLVEGGNEVPEGHYQGENMKETVVPNRNKIFASIIQAVALSLANQTKEHCDIALGIHAGDHDIYPDCRQEFRDADDVAFRLGNWEAERVGYFTPYIYENKFTILQDGEKLCNILWLNFNEVYFNTMTSYKPIYIEIKDLNNQFLGHKVYSDYKSASSVERIEAFINLCKPDPIEYADLEGPKSWDYVSNYVKTLILNYKNNE